MAQTGEMIKYSPVYQLGKLLRRILDPHRKWQPSTWLARAIIRLRKIRIKT